MLYGFNGTGQYTEKKALSEADKCFNWRTNFFIHFILVSSTQETQPPSSILMVPTAYLYHCLYHNSGNGTLNWLYSSFPPYHHKHTSTTANSTAVFCLYNFVRVILTLFSLGLCRNVTYPDTSYFLQYFFCCTASTPALYFVLPSKASQFFLFINSISKSICNHGLTRPYTHCLLGEESNFIICLLCFWSLFRCWRSGWQKIIIAKIFRKAKRQVHNQPLHCLSDDTNNLTFIYCFLSSKSLPIFFFFLFCSSAYLA